MNQDNRSILEAELIRDEGLKLRVYKDSVGKATIGVGRNLDRLGALSKTEALTLGCTVLQLRQGHQITNNQALLLLDNDIEDVENQLDAKLPWWRKMDEVRQRALANMCFNMGIGVLMEFNQTLGAMKLGQYERAAALMLQSKWARQVGKRAIRVSQLMKLGTNTPTLSA